MADDKGARPPILRDKHCRATSEFTPESLLREARRQKGLRDATVPAVCVLDPDGDIVRHLRATGAAELDLVWACYHSELYHFERNGREYGIIGCAVGASYAVLVAEQMFAAGYSACFIGAIKAVAGKMKVTVPADVAVDAEVDLGPIPNAYGIAARLKVSLPGMERAAAQALVDAAHQVCPYSNATRGNIDVTITVV